MYLARIVGRVVATQKQDTLAAIPLQWLQPVGADGADSGAPLVAADTFGLGPGEPGHAHRHRLQPGLLEPGDDPPDDALLDAVGLDDGKGALDSHVLVSPRREGPG
jgi:hypothetical protein